MTTIPLTSALRLLRQFGDNPDTVAVIEKAIAELERLYKVEEYAVSLKEAELARLYASEQGEKAEAVK